MLGKEDAYTDEGDQGRSAHTPTTPWTQHYHVASSIMPVEYDAVSSSAMASNRMPALRKLPLISFFDMTYNIFSKQTLRQTYLLFRCFKGRHVKTWMNKKLLC